MDGLHGMILFVWRENFLPFDAYCWDSAALAPFFSVHISRRQDANFPERMMASRRVKAQVFPIMK
jgi:hypothetical protein